MPVGRSRDFVALLPKLLSTVTDVALGHSTSGSCRLVCIALTRLGASIQIKRQLAAPGPPEQRTGELPTLGIDQPVLLNRRLLLGLLPVRPPYGGSIDAGLVDPRIADFPASRIAKARDSKLFEEVTEISVSCLDGRSAAFSTACQDLTFRASQARERSRRSRRGSNQCRRRDQ